MVTARVEAFSLTHAQILDGTKTFLEEALAATTAEDLDIYGVNDASLTPNIDNYENEGDDAVLSRWTWLNYAEMAVQAGYLSFPLIANLTGQSISSAGSGNAKVFELDLWHEDSVNVAPRPMLIKMPSKDEDGLIRTLTIGLYKVSFDPITFDGPKYKDGLKVNYNGTALKSGKDEKGQPFADGRKRVGRLISHV
jgi:hypothetical protein